MITTNEVQNILIHDCADFGIQTFPTWNVPEGRIKDERIVVVTPSEQSPATYWESCYISVNLCVPDVKGTANLKRLGELERIAKAKFKPWAYGIYDNTPYCYRYEGIGREEDKDLGCHYIYVRALFRVLNVKKD